MSTELDVPRTTNLVLIPRLTAVELEAKNQKIPKVNPDLPTEEMKSPQPQSEVHPTRKAQRTIFRDTVSSLRHARQVPEGNRDPGYHSSTIPFGTLPGQPASSNLPHRPPSPKLSYNSQHVPPATFPPLDHYNLQRQFYPLVPSQNPMLVPQVQQNQVNWAPIPQASC